MKTFAVVALFAVALAGGTVVASPAEARFDCYVMACGR